ncbi:FtsX-like permease family protein [Candidatus Saccharibacteria bacterium]|nr:FtsX-like permease family protein [Candidatus Saccharibacteria bacterium]
MGLVTRGVRNAFRSGARAFSIIAILGLSIGLALAMLLAHQAVEQKINSVKSSVGNTITVSPAGVRGFEGGGNALTQTQVDKLKTIEHVSSVGESLNDRLTSTNTNLQSAVEAGDLGRRFSQNSGQTFTPPPGFSSDGQSGGNLSFTPPVTLLGTTDPTSLSSTQGGGSFSLKSGKAFDSASTDNVALVGSALATKNNLSVGSTFTAYGNIVTVVGVFDAGNTFSNNQLIMPLATVQKLSTQTGSLTGAVVNVDSISNVDSVTAQVKSVLGTTADVTSSKSQVQDSIAPLQNIASISSYSLVGAVVAGAVIVLLSMVMIVRERRREIGVIKAIGASNLKIMSQFMAEAVTLTILGAVVGIVLGVVAGNPITKMLVNNSSSSTTSQLMGAGTEEAGPQIFRSIGGGVRDNLSNIHASVGWDIILYGLGAAVLIATIGSMSASWFIAKVRPAEVMRTE